MNLDACGLLAELALLANTTLSVNIWRTRRARPVPTHLKMRPLSEIPAPVKVSAPRAWLPGSNTCDGSRRLLRRCDLVCAVSISAKNIVRLTLGRSRSWAKVRVHVFPHYVPVGRYLEEPPI